MNTNRFLEVNYYIDYNDARIMAKVNSQVFSCLDQQETIYWLFHFVRDQILYDAYSSFYPASTVLVTGRGNSFGKAFLLAALCRALKIPAGFILQQINDMIMLKHHEKENTYENAEVQWHAVTAVLLCGKWYKLDTSWDRWFAMGRNCQVPNFDGMKDALLPEKDFNQKQNYKILNQSKIIASIPERIEDLCIDNLLTIR